MLPPQRELIKTAGSDVPWHRVINSQGRISTSCREHDARHQQALLEAEGIVFGEHGTVDWDRFGWAGLSFVVERAAPAADQSVRGIGDESF